MGVFRFGQNVTTEAFVAPRDPSPSVAMPLPSTPMGSHTDTVALVIPAWQPDEQLVTLLKSLYGAGFAAIIVVNDGSSQTHDELFHCISSISSTIVLHHVRNHGQGRAVKTGLAYAAHHLPRLCGVVTADADGQHAANDIVRVAEALARSHGRPVLGTRAFAAGVPFRSRFGNILTRYVFWLLSGAMVTDTQSGLRGIPRGLIPAALRVRADRYEFAVSLLALFCRLGAPPLEVPIETIYLDGNRSSHFRPLRDSMRIYLHLARCYASSLIAVCVDLAAFWIAYALVGRLAASMFAGRLAAIALPSLLIEGFSCPQSRLLKRAASLLLTGALALSAIYLLTQSLDWNVLGAKLLVESVLYLVIRLRSRSKQGMQPHSASADIALSRPL